MTEHNNPFPQNPHTQQAGQAGAGQPGANQDQQQTFGQNQYQQAGTHQQPGQHSQQYPGNPYPGQQQFQQPVDFDAYGNPIATDAKTMSLLSHLSSLILNIVTASTLSFLGPLIFWFIYKDKPGYKFTAANSARAFNFNFTLWLINLAGWIILIITFGLGTPVSALIWMATTVLMFVFHIIGAVRANRGEVYDYPMQIKILKD